MWLSNNILTRPLDDLRTKRDDGILMEYLTFGLDTLLNSAFGRSQEAKFKLWLRKHMWQSTWGHQVAVTW